MKLKMKSSRYKNENILKEGGKWNEFFIEKAGE